MNCPLAWVQLQVFAFLPLVRQLPEQVSVGALQSVAQFEQFSDAWQMSLPQQ